jgi:NDP-hexose 4-ketoreductase
MPIGDRHPRVVAFAAGPSRTSAVAAQCDREAALLTEVVATCRRTGDVLLYFSTAAAALYPETDTPSREDDPVVPRRPYGRHKHAMEIMIAGSGCRYLILRLSHLVGPDQPRHQLVPALTEQIRAGTVTVHTCARRDLIDIADAVTILDALLRAGITGQVVNVASGHSVPVADVVAGLEARLDCVAVRRWVDGGDTHQISIDKVSRLIPLVGEIGFGPGYYHRILDRYVTAVLARTL